MRHINKLKCWKQWNNSVVFQRHHQNGDLGCSRYFNAEIWKKRFWNRLRQDDAAWELSRTIPIFLISQPNYQKTNHTSRFVITDSCVVIKWETYLSLLFEYACYFYRSNIFFPSLIRKIKSTINSLDKSFFLVNFVKRQHMAFGRLICVRKTLKSEGKGVHCKEINKGRN